MAGMVYLVGAGPGDYQLISMKAVEYLKIADTVVYDRLADDRLLGYARKDAEYIYVGKASSRHTMKQEEINQLLVDKAKEGKIVVRLKGGDPFVFGRGGEEALLLEENGLPFEIVPGITSAIAVPAYAGIPVTHRGVATSFAVITGHEDPTKGSSTMRWDKLSTGVDTLVFLMGVENIARITQQLIANGRAADTPAAVIRWGTKPEQYTLVTTVGEAAADVQKYDIKPPAIFIVGDVVNLREQLAWFDKRPLFGKTFLVTRAREQASLLTQKLEALGARCIEAPAIQIVPPPSYEALSAAFKVIKSYQWIIFTSANGVARFFEQLMEAGLDARALGNAKIVAIGASTAKKLRGYGVCADIVPAEFVAEGILAALADEVQAGDRILIPRALEAREVLPEKLREAGAVVDVAPVYQTITGESDGAEIMEMLVNRTIDCITFTSSSTVKNLLQLIGEANLGAVQSAQTACIGPVTAKTCLEMGLEPSLMAKEYTIDGLVEVLLAAFAPTDR